MKEMLHSTLGGEQGGKQGGMKEAVSTLETSTSVKGRGLTQLSQSSLSQSTHYNQIS